MAVTQATLRLAARLRTELLRITNQQTRDLTAAWVDAWNGVAGDLDSAINDLAAHADNGHIRRAAILQSKRLRNALDAIARELTRLGDLAGVRIVDDLETVVASAAARETAVIGSQLPAGERARLTGLADARQLDAIVQRTTERITSATYPLSSDAYAVLRRELVRGLVAGRNPRTTAARVVKRAEGGFNGGLARALTISRTETLDAYRTAAAASHKANEDVLRGWVWVAALSDRTCPACLGMNGTEHPLREAGPLGHQNCVLPGAIVSGPRASTSTTRWFDGEVIDLEVAGGHRLSVTPNHPVLTPNGWVAAGQLREGMHVVCGSGTERVARGDVPDDHQVPALIEDVAESVGRAASMPAVRMPTAAEDFHGDGAGSQVHVVRTDSRLVHERLAALAQQRRQQQFAVGDVGLALFASLGSELEFLSAAHSSADSFMSGGRVGAVLLDAASRHHGAVRLGDITGSHTCVLEQPVDVLAGHAERLGQPVDGLTGAVPLDYPMPLGEDLAVYAGKVADRLVLRVSRRHWAGHVYNLQTATGWYVANGILTHNCRCTRLPLTKSWRDLGLDLDEPDDLAIPDSDTWFRGQPVKVQQQILGLARYKAWRRGDYPVSDWATKRANPGWRPSYTTSPVPELKRPGYTDRLRA